MIYKLIKTLVLKLFENYSNKSCSNQVLRKLVKLASSLNVNQNLIIPTFTDTFWCQLVLIIVISRLRDLKHRHLAGAFFLALIQDNIAELSKLNCVPNVLKYNPD